MATVGDTGAGGGAGATATTVSAPVNPAERAARERTPGAKLGFTLLIGLLLVIPLLTVYLLNYDRQNQSNVARTAITQGWGGQQTLAGPLLVIPYTTQTTETVEEGGKQVTRTRTITRELTLAPQTVEATTALKPERRKKSIYEAVLYQADMAGKARFTMPADLPRFGVDPGTLALDRAELRFGVSDARGLFGAPPTVSVNGARLPLQPGHGPDATSGAGFYGWVDARTLPAQPLAVDFAFVVRGNGAITYAPRAGDTTWNVKSVWPSPSFTGGFLPEKPTISDAGFESKHRIGNLALGQSLVETGDAGSTGTGGGGSPPEPMSYDSSGRSDTGTSGAATNTASVALVQPIDLYDQIERATKYGFLFIGFTFLAFLMFDIIGGVRVSAVEYLLVGVALVLFFVLLLALAEVIGFTPAYLVGSAAIIGLVTAYSAAVLKSWRRAGYIAGLLAALYAVLYILLSLEAYSLLIGSLMLFAALAGVMYVTRNLDWGAVKRSATAPDGGRVAGASA